MQMLLDLLTALLPLLYGLAAANYAVYFVRRDDLAERTCTPLLLGTVLLHATFLGLRFVAFDRLPLANLPEIVSAIAFALAGVYLYVERLQRSRTTGVFLVSMAALVQVGASAYLPHAPAGKAPLLYQTSLWSLHTAAVVLGYSAFLVSAVYAVMYWLLYRALKRKRFGLMFERLPSLDVLARMGMVAASLGLLFLTAVIGLGVLMSARLVPHFYTDPKFIATVVVWLVYAVAVTAYFLLGWRGARAVMLSTVGFGLALLMMLGSSLFHSFHSFNA